LTAADQHRRIKESSRRLWQSIETRIPYGKDVLALLLAISLVAVDETSRPNAPYAPGVTGTAIPYFSRRHLLDEEVSTRPQIARLKRALVSAVANNLLEMSPDIYHTKNQQLTVLNLNRLLLPELNLPLNRGGFREQKIETLARKVEAIATAPLDFTLGYTIDRATIKGWPK
jgi:hypothetical protein